MDIQSAVNTPFVRIRVIAFVHFALLVNAMLSDHLPLAYLFYNLLFMVSLMWAVAVRDSIDAIHTCAAINFSSIFFDFVIIISYFGHAQIWAIIFAVFNLVARPFSLLLLHKEVVDRGGDFVIVSPLPTNISNGSRTPRSYQDIDSPRQASGQQLPSF